MAKSNYAVAVDGIQKSLVLFLRARNFKVKGRTFNRLTDDGLTQVINIQMGASDPPVATHIPEFTDDFHGKFTINLGVYVPEVARVLGCVPRSWVQDYSCCLRSRLGELMTSGKNDIWWNARNEPAVVSDVQGNIETLALPFLDKYGCRDRFLKEFTGRTENLGAAGPPRITLAIILAERGDTNGARKLLAAQAKESIAHPGHAQYVRKLAAEMGLGALESGE